MTEDLKEQIRKAQAEMATWSEDKRKSIRLEGTDLWLSNAPPDDGFATFTKAQCDSLKPTQGADARPVAIYQIAVAYKDAEFWGDTSKTVYDVAIDSKRIVYATRDTAPSDVPQVAFHGTMTVFGDGSRDYQFIEPSLNLKHGKYEVTCLVAASASREET